MSNEVLNRIIDNVNEKIQQGVPAGLTEHEFAVILMEGVYSTLSAIESGAFSRSQLYLMSQENRVKGLK